MAVSSGMDSHELSDLVRNMYRTAEQHYPDRAKDFLKDQANAGRRKLRAKTKAVTKKRAGICSKASAGLESRSTAMTCRSVSITRLHMPT